MHSLRQMFRLGNAGEATNSQGSDHIPRASPHVAVAVSTAAFGLKADLISRHVLRHSHANTSFVLTRHTNAFSRMAYACW